MSKRRGRAARRSFGLLAIGMAIMALSGAAATEGGRARHLVGHDDVRIDVIAEGRGPLIVMLPSRGRDSEDFDEVAERVAAAGFRVLRPQPRGIGESHGKLDGLTFHDFARDIAAVIEHERAGPAVIVGHAFGNWVARMTAVDHPPLVRGVILAAAGAKSFPAELSEAVNKSGDASLPDAERLKYLEYAFFAPGHDARVWLTGWSAEASKSQREATRATKQSEWWTAGTVPLLDIQAEKDPFKPRAVMNELKDEFGDRVTIIVIPNASHALIPEQPKAVAEAIVAWTKTLP
jgi:pimeloyl-ACP methyl ester carboxylesterase